MIGAPVRERNNELPLVINREMIGPEMIGFADAGPVALNEWFRSNVSAAESKLVEHGAILFRAFGVNTVQGFAKLIESMGRSPAPYTDGNSPRTRLSPGIYTSTEFPPEYFISLHNELSYSAFWPSKLMFVCIRPADRGGETPLASSAEILRHLDPAIVSEFTRRQIKYIRNLHSGYGAGPSWQATFGTSNKIQVEEFCSMANIQFQWLANDDLRLTNVRPAVALHPRTGERVWFNQADQFHPSTHPPEVYQSLIALCGSDPDSLPQNARFGDDGEIDVEMLNEIRKTANALMVRFPWQEGDLLLIDNMLVAHGRMPFTGTRKIIVSMFE